MKFKRYFIVPMSSLPATGPGFPDRYHAHHMSDARHALLVTEDDEFDIDGLPQGWMPLPHVMLQQQLPAAAVALLSADYGVTATDTTVTAMMKAATAAGSAHRPFR